MTTIPKLAPCFDKEFVAEIDALGKGLGVVLLEEGRPVAYISQTLLDWVQQKLVCERELMAIVLVVQKWRHYLLGRKFVVHINQKSLRFLVYQ